MSSPRPVMQQMLDVALARAPEQARAQFGLLLAEREHGQAPPLTGARILVPDDVESLTAWITSSNTSDEAIEHIEQATVALADMHTQVTASRVLADVLQLHRKTHTLLRSGKQRLRQTRELIRIDSDLLAHASVLLGDLGQAQAARNYGRAALTGMQEAETSQAKAWYALAKTARWQDKNYAEAADLAQRGFEDGPVNPMSVQLAYYEANAAALAGDTSRAKTALARAEMFADAMPCTDTGISPWSFPPERQAIFALSVALRTGDADGALREHGRRSRLGHRRSAHPQHLGADTDRRRHRAPAQDSLDGAIEQVTPMLAMPPEFRIATVTGFLAYLDQRLASRRYANSQAASEPAAANPRLHRQRATTTRHQGGQMTTLPAQMIDRWHNRESQDQAKAPSTGTCS